MKSKYSSAVLLFSVLIMTSSCAQNQAEWKGTIEEKDGVIIVKNPLEPTYNKEDLVSILPDLSIGGDTKQKKYLFQEQSR